MIRPLTFKYACSVLLFLLVLTHGKEDEDGNGNANGNDDAYYDTCTDPNTSPKKLTPNTFHRICPETTRESLGQPICGDGTEFSFAYTSPTQRKSNEEKIVIEFQGGGACWSADTCGQAGDRLTFPESINDFIGYSCSAVAYAGDNIDGYPASFLCDTTIGDTDLSTYHYIMVPYCTQDVHLGDNIIYYNEGESVYHHGAHNMMSVLKWVYKHFSNPSHIFLTGCSAGGSALPVAYDLLNHHYNSFLKGGRTVNINTIMDSAVYLTPKYFISNGMPNWNTDTILSKTNFNSDQEHSVLYSTYLWEHVLQRGSRKDKWGFLSHTNDPVSMKYWQAMGAGYYDDDQNGNDCDSWYSDMSQSLSLVQDSHKNAETYYMDGEGHCSLGLYYGLQDEGFGDWAGAIVREQTILKRSSESLPLFFMSVAVGGVLMASALLWKSKAKADKDGALLSEEDPAAARSNNVMDRMKNALAPLLPIGKRFSECPVTTFYFATMSLYFLCVLIDGGFTHPLNNPSLGPSATTLSKFGINNPTLIVQKKQIFRLLSSGFMCSGVLTFGISTICVFKSMRHTERVCDNTAAFAISAAFIMIGSNLVYTCFGSGASCGSLGFVLGMNVFSIGLSKKLGEEAGLQTPKCSTVFYMILALTIFPFNSWILIVSAMIAGSILPFVVVKEVNEDPNVNEWMPKPLRLSRPFVLYAVPGFFGLLFILILAGVPSPNQIYQYPYLTGCGMMFSTDIGSIAQNFGGRRLQDGGFDYGNMGCAQFCVPHLVDKPFYFGLKRYSAYSGNEYVVDYGSCEDIGYDEHVADTTFEYWNYPLDVEVYEMGEDE